MNRGFTRPSPSPSNTIFIKHLNKLVLLINITITTVIFCSCQPVETKNKSLSPEERGIALRSSIPNESLYYVNIKDPSNPKDSFSQSFQSIIPTIQAQLSTNQTISADDVQIIKGLIDQFKNVQAVLTLAWKDLQSGPLISLFSLDLSPTLWVELSNPTLVKEWLSTQAQNDKNIIQLHDQKYNIDYWKVGASRWSLIVTINSNAIMITLTPLHLFEKTRIQLLDYATNQSPNNNDLLAQDFKALHADATLNLWVNLPQLVQRIFGRSNEGLMIDGKILGLPIQGAESCGVELTDIAQALGRVNFISMPVQKGEPGNRRFDLIFHGSQEFLKWLNQLVVIGPLQSAPKDPFQLDLNVSTSGLLGLFSHLKAQWSPPNTWNCPWLGSLNQFTSLAHTVSNSNFRPMLAMLKGISIWIKQLSNPKAQDITQQSLHGTIGIIYPNPTTTVALAQLSNQIPSWLKALTLKEDGIPRSIEGVQGQWTHPLISFGSQGLFISSLPKTQADDAHKRFHTELNADHHKDAKRPLMSLALSPKIREYINEKTRSFAQQKGILNSTLNSTQNYLRRLTVKVNTSTLVVTQHMSSPIDKQ